MTFDPKSWSQGRKTKQSMRALPYQALLVHHYILLYNVRDEPIFKEKRCSSKKIFMLVSLDVTFMG